ncbi:MAG: hypothetical protein KA015_05800, partial [Spirochaetes bacterium]|nr:hypothetical protein [Spirochaetota bacterium]
MKKTKNTAAYFRLIFFSLNGRINAKNKTAIIEIINPWNFTPALIADEVAKRSKSKALIIFLSVLRKSTIDNAPIAIGKLYINSPFVAMKYLLNEQ